MEIKATGKLTLDAIGTLLHATMFRGKSPKREIVKISAVIALCTITIDMLQYQKKSSN